MRAGIGYGRRGLTAYYERDRRHGHHGHHHDRHCGVSYWGEFYAGVYYPYGYASSYDSYYYRYPYRYVRAYDYYPSWTVYVEPAETVYVESPVQTVYIEQAGGTDQAYQSQEIVEPVETAPPVYAPTEEVVPVMPDDSGGPDDSDSPGDSGTQEQPSDAQTDGMPPVVDGEIQVEPQQRIPVNNALLADAARQFQEGQYDEARSSLARAVLNDPQNGFAELAYGLGLFAVGDYEAAARAVRRGLALAPDVADRPIDVSRQYRTAEDFQGHLQSLRLHVAAHPEQQDAWFLLGYLRFSNGRPVEAMRALEKAASLDPQDTYAAVLRDAAARVQATPVQDTGGSLER